MKVRVKEMKYQDSKNRENINIKQLEENFRMQAKSVLGIADEQLIASILMRQEETLAQENRRLMQEHHNSGHALWFLAMVVYGITHNSSNFSTEKKSFKTLAHLICLKEFISYDEVNLRKMIVELIEAIQTKSPHDHNTWTDFIYKHWNAIVSLAEHYGHREKCFPHSEYGKICAIIHKKEGSVQ